MSPDRYFKNAYHKLMETLRFADPATSVSYPLPVRGNAQWIASDAGTLWTLRLPSIPAGSIVTPSFAQLPDTDQHYRWHLRCSGRAWTLQAVPSVRHPTLPDRSDPAPSAPTAAEPEPVTTHIDCFHVHETLKDAELTLQLAAAAPFSRYLLTVSARRLDRAAVGVPPCQVSLPQAPPALTQMTADAAVAGRICSPTCVAMVMAHRERPSAATDWNPLRDDMVAACLDPATGMYGVWPLALRSAAQRGSLGAVEMFDDWRDPLQVLAAGIPLITSIRFPRGGLSGAPLEQTGGHLVVLYAAGPDHVWVNDPAAAESGSVRRHYAADEFSKAWLSHRGAAYILLP